MVKLDLSPNSPNTLDGRELLAAIEECLIAACFLDPQYRGVLDKLRYGNEGVRRGRRRAALRQQDGDEIREFAARRARCGRLATSSSGSTSSTSATASRTGSPARRSPPSTW